MRPGAPGALSVRRPLPLLALLEYLLAHLGIAKHGEEHRPAKDISGERWQKERQSRLAEGREPSERAIERLCRTRHDVGEAEERNEIGQQADNKEFDALGRGDDPNQGGDQPAGADALREHLHGHVAHKLINQTCEPRLEAFANHRQKREGAGEHETAPHVGGKHDEPEPLHPEKPGELPMRHDRQHGRQHVLGEKLSESSYVLS